MLNVVIKTESTHRQLEEHESCVGQWRKYCKSCLLEAVSTSRGRQCHNAAALYGIYRHANTRHAEHRRARGGGARDPLGDCGTWAKHPPQRVRGGSSVQSAVQFTASLTARDHLANTGLAERDEGGVM